MHEKVYKTLYGRILKRVAEKPEKLVKMAISGMFLLFFEKLYMFCT